jgi:hypothetical protein
MLGILAMMEYGPSTPVGYAPGPVRFVACGPLAAVVGVDLTAALTSAFVVVLLTEATFGRTMSSRARVRTVGVIGAMIFGLSFGGALLLRRRLMVCA